jgi:translation initiation factor 1
MNKKFSRKDGIVYSTDPGFSGGEDMPGDLETLAPEKQKLKLRLDTKQRAGKAVTLVEGLIAKTEDLEEFGKKLKTFCGTGGSVKDGIVIIQGDQRDKMLTWLLKNGYKQTKKI